MQPDKQKGRGDPGKKSHLCHHSDQVGVCREAPGVSKVSRVVSS